MRINSIQSFSNTNTNMRTRYNSGLRKNISFSSGVSANMWQELPPKTLAVLSRIPKQVIMLELTPKNVKIAEKLLSMTKKDGSLVFDNNSDENRLLDVMGVLHVCNVKKDIESANALLDVKDEKENPKYTYNEVKKLLYLLNNDNRQLLNTIFAIDTPRLDFDCLSDILREITAENIGILQPLLTMKNDDDSYRFDMYIYEKDYNIVNKYQDDIPLILSKTNSKNFDRVKEHINAKDDKGNYKYSPAEVFSACK